MEVDSPVFLGGEAVKCQKRGVPGQEGDTEMEGGQQENVTTELLGVLQNLMETKMP